MKKFTLFIFLLASGFTIAQEKIDEKQSKYPQDIDKKHELKLNAFNLIAFSALDVTYERLINLESSYGVSLFYNFSELDGNFDYTKKFSLTPYYRWFFSENRFARGFFVEGFGMLNTVEDIVYNYNSVNTIESQTSFALGISVGGKFITKSGFVTEVHLGIGRNIIKGASSVNFFDNDIVGRFGISLGYRF
jgi:hypothetical protein